MIDFNKILSKSTKGFEDKVKDKLKGYADNALTNNGLPSFSDLQNIQKDAYEKVLRNHNWGIADANLGFLENDMKEFVINNSAMLGLANKSATNDDIKDNPTIVTSKAQQNKNVPSSVLRYPLPNSEERIPYMEIKGFKYAYDANDTVGNKSSHVVTERTATIHLPLPGNLASGLSMQYEDYNSVFAKLVRAHNGEEAPSIDGVVDAIKTTFDSISPDVWADGAAAGALAGIFTGAMDGSVGSAISTTIDEGLKFIRVQGGIAVNPMSQASYVGSNIRTHSFEFNMVPRNNKESIECKRIIEMLQYCSLGERRKELGGILMNFPSVWNVAFLNHDGKPIGGMLEIPDAFLTEVNVTYSPTRAGFTVTRDNDPFAYVLTLTFKEAQNLIRDDLSYIRQGGSLLPDHPITPKDAGITEIDLTKVDKETVIASDVASTDGNNPKAGPVQAVANKATSVIMVPTIKTALEIKGAADKATAAAITGAGNSIQNGNKVLAVGVVTPTVNAAKNVNKATKAVTAFPIIQAVKIANATQSAKAKLSELLGGDK